MNEGQIVFDGTYAAMMSNDALTHLVEECKNEIRIEAAQRKEEELTDYLSDNSDEIFLDDNNVDAKNMIGSVTHSTVTDIISRRRYSTKYHHRRFSTFKDHNKDITNDIAINKQLTGTEKVETGRVIFLKRTKFLCI